MAQDFQLPLATVLLGCAGVALIGLTNLAVSFSLALWVALRSRKLSGDLLWPLVPMLFKRFLGAPLSFFLPPKSPPPENGGEAGDAAEAKHGSSIEGKPGPRRRQPMTAARVMTETTPSVISRAALKS